jgi:hypothetical protein
MGTNQSPHRWCVTRWSVTRGPVCETRGSRGVGSPVRRVCGPGLEDPGGIKGHAVMASFEDQ